MLDSFRFGAGCKKLCAWCLLATIAASNGYSSSEPLPDENSLALPRPGFSQLTIISPDVLELFLVTTKRAYPAPVEQWNFVDDKGQTHLPSPADFAIMAGDRKLAVSAVGFKRRVLYAPFKNRDLRIANYLYLKLSGALHDNEDLKVTNPGGKLWPPAASFAATAHPGRLSPAIHVNQTGYLTQMPKRAIIGYYLGSLGELELDQPQGGSDAGRTNLLFEIVNAQSTKPLF